jgi:hypothetical protein
LNDQRENVENMSNGIRKKEHVNTHYCKCKTSFCFLPVDRSKTLQCWRSMLWRNFNKTNECAFKGSRKLSMYLYFSHGIHQTGFCTSFYLLKQLSWFLESEAVELCVETSEELNSM